MERPFTQQKLFQISSVAASATPADALTCELKTMQWEFAALSILKARGEDYIHFQQGDLLDNFSFLALSGTTAQSQCVRVLNSLIVLNFMLKIVQTWENIHVEMCAHRYLLFRAVWLKPSLCTTRVHVAKDSRFLHVISGWSFAYSEQNYFYAHPGKILMNYA